jgi:CRP-like cAMP-binding protein
VAAALGRVSLFAGLDDATRAAIALRLVDRTVAAGAAIDDDGALTVIRQGRAAVLAPSLAGHLTEIGQLGPGDTFGLGAILGGDSGTSLRASEPLTVSVLDAEALRELTLEHPSVAAALSGRRSTVTPSGGQRLSRVTFGAGPRRLTVTGDVDPQWRVG